jgi:hypothetical protein
LPIIALLAQFCEGAVQFGGHCVQDHRSLALRPAGSRKRQRPRRNGRMKSDFDRIPPCGSKEYLSRRLVIR